MSQNVKVKLNRSGFRELLKSAELADGLGDIAAGIAARAGDGYASDVYQASSRVIASAYTESIEAIRDCAKNNGDPLLGAMQG